MQREWLLYCIVEQQNEELREEQYYYLCKRKSKRKLALFRIIFYRGKVVKERESKRSSISQGKFETQLKPRKSLFSVSFVLNTVFENHRKSLIFNIVSEANYDYILSEQKFLKMPKNGPIRRVFENVRLAVKQCYQTGQFQ